MFIGVTVHAVLFIDTIHQKKSVLRFIVRERTVNGIEDSDRDAKDALSKLLQMGTMAEYENKFVILANRVTWISENLLKSLYISGLKPTLQCAFLRSKPTTLGEAFSLARATEARFTEDALSKLLQMGTVAKYQNEFEMLIKRVTRISEFLLKSFYISRLKPALQIELLRAKPTTLVEAFSLARMIEARFKDKRNTTTIVNPNDLNIAIPDQVLEESILHMSDKVEITSDNDAQDQASEVETNVLVDGKQDDAKVMKVVGVVVKQNNDKPNVLKGNGVIGVGVNEISKWVDKEVQYPVSTLHVRILLLKRLNDKHIKKKKMKAEIQRRIWNPGIKIIFFRHHLVDKVFSKEWRVLRQCCRRTDGPNSPRGRSPIPFSITRLDLVVITLAFGDRGQGFDPHSLQGRRSFPTFGRTGSSLSALGRGITVYVSTSPIHRATVLGPITRARRKPVEKTTRVSLASDVTPGPSSGVRAAYPRDRQGYVGLSRGLGMLIPLYVLSVLRPPGDSGSLDLSDTAIINPVLEATSLPKSSKNCKPCLKDAPTSLKKWKDKFFLVDRRAAPIAMPWRHHDFSVSDPILKPDEYNASDVTKLREVVIPLRKPPPSILYIAGLSNVWKHAGRAFSIKDSNGEVITMAEFLRLPDFHGCKVSAGELLPPGSARVTHLTTPAERVEDIPPKTGDMMVAELPCRKVLDDKERKKRKAEEKIAIHVQAEKVVKEKDGREGVRKKRRVRVVNPVQPTSEHVSSPTPLNHDEPLTTIAGEAHVTPPTSVGRMGVLRDQTDEPVTPPVTNVGKFPTGGEDGQDGVDAMFANEGHGDNEGGLSGLQTQPSPACPADRLLETVEKPASDKIVLDTEARSSRIDNSRQCRDMMSNLFTPADLEFFNEGVRHESAVKRSWKMLCQSAQQQANVLLRFESLMEEHADLVYAHESCNDVKNYDGALIREKSLQERVEELEKEKREAEQLTSEQADRIKHLEETLKQSEVEAQQLRFDKEKYAVEAGQGEMRSLGEAFSLAVGKGFIDGISIGRKEEDIRAILKAALSVDPSSSDTFMETYEKLFDKRYPYVDKVARMYLLDPSGLQNVMSDEIGPTPGGGPHDTPTASYS
ncbi:hypothetical protein Tco_0499618 [Tanacetum coccineum]